MKDKLLLKLSELTNLRYMDKPMCLYGIYRGYNISINNINSIYTIDLPLKAADDIQIDKINSFLNDLKKEFKKLNYASYKNYTIKLQYNPQLKKYMNPEILISLLNTLIDFATLNSLNTCCEFCGEENDITPFLIDQSIAPCCKNCQFEIKNTINENQNNYKSKNNNVIGGIVGGFIGALIGSILWIIIYQMNYIAAIAGLAIAICCIKGYQLFGGKLNISGIIITSLITLFMVYFANHISLAISIYSEFNTYYDITFFDALRSVPAFLSEPEVVSVFIKDLLMGYVLTIAGSAYYVKKSYKDANYKIKAEEINL